MLVLRIVDQVDELMELLARDYEFVDCVLLWAFAKLPDDLEAFKGPSWLLLVYEADEILKTAFDVLTRMVAKLLLTEMEMYRGHLN